MIYLTLRKLAHVVNIEFFFQLLNLKISLEKFDIFNVFVQNIDCGYSLEPPRRSGSNVPTISCFGSKIREIGIPMYTPVLLYKSGVLGGILFMDITPNAELNRSCRMILETSYDLFKKALTLRLRT